MNRDGVDVVALILALAVLVVVLTFAALALVDELRGRHTLALGPGAAQVISDVVGSLVALLGAYMGYRVGERRRGQ